MEISSALSVFFILTALAILAGGFFIVEQNQTGLVERFGKFVRVANAGLNFKIPLIEKNYRVNNRLQQLDVDVETKTNDNVFVKIKVSVQYQISDAPKAFYTLSNYREQISSYVFDVVRAQVPKLTLDSVFEKKDDVADVVKAELSESMDDFGFKIVKALVTDIDPDQKVKAAMNEINAATRMREAATEKAEAEKILEVKKAEGEAESKRLQGIGIAAQRKAIVDGLRESVHEMSQATGSDTATVMSLILMTQYFDTLKSLGEHGAATILLPHQPGSVADIQNQIIAGMRASGVTAK